MAQLSWGGGLITFSVSGMEPTSRKIRQLATFGARIASLEVPFTQIGEDLLADFARNMMQEGGLFARSQKWAPLAPSTVAERIREGVGGEHPILWRTGRLGHSLSDRGNPDNIFEVTRDSLRVGTRVPYAQYHQRGSRKRTVRVKTLMVDQPRHRRFEESPVLPQRTIVGISWTRRGLITRRLGDWVREQVAASGLGAGGGAASGPGMETP